MTESLKKRLEERSTRPNLDFRFASARKLIEVLDPRLTGETSGPVLDRLLCVFRLGGAILKWLEQDPDLVAELQFDEFPGKIEFEEFLQRSSASDPVADLRQLRRRMAFRIAAIEMSQMTDTEATVEASRSLSELACVILERLLRVHNLEQDIAIIALGKLGGLELNYASDVDLMYTGENASGSVLRRLGQFNRDLERVAAPGRLYRVDLRLRPYGRSGPMIVKRSGLERYYQSKAETWERLALVRASFAAGNKEHGTSFFDTISSFLWEQNLDNGAIQNYFALKARTASQHKDRDKNLKHCAGGIRDNEAITQFLQLLHGRDLPELRFPGTPTALLKLAESEMLAREEADKLRDSYLFQRKLEHLLQIQTDREHEYLPDNEKELTELEVIASYFELSVTELEQQLKAHQLVTREFLAEMLELGFATQVAVEDPIARLSDLLLASEPDRQLAGRLLEELGFKSGRSAFNQLQSLGTENNPYLRGSSRANLLLAGLSRQLLPLVLASVRPDKTLRNLSMAVETVGAKATFLQLLLGDPETLKLFVTISSESDFLIEALARQPSVFDEVIDRLLTRFEISQSYVLAAIEKILSRSSSVEEKLADLKEFKAVNTLHIGLLATTSNYNVQNVSADLSLVADGVVSALYRIARNSVNRGFDLPSDSESHCELGIFAVGKLGGRELSYGSDYDVLVFYRGGAASQSVKIGAQQYANKVVQELLKLGKSSDAVGDLAPLDLRLRPSGNRGLLAQSLESALKYYRREGKGDQAQEWEGLALTRLRAIAGDSDFMGVAQEALLHARDTLARAGRSELWAEIAQMRERQSERLRLLDIKQSRGCLVDIEYLLEGLSLLNSEEFPQLRQANIPRLIDEARGVGILSDLHASELKTAYQFFRAIELKLRLVSGLPGTTLPAEVSDWRGLALRLGYLDSNVSAEQNFANELKYFRGVVNNIVTTVSSMTDQS